MYFLGRWCIFENVYPEGLWMCYRYLDIRRIKEYRNGTGKWCWGCKWTMSLLPKGPNGLFTLLFLMFLHYLQNKRKLKIKTPLKDNYVLQWGNNNAMAKSHLSSITTNLTPTRSWCKSIIIEINYNIWNDNVFVSASMATFIFPIWEKISRKP